MENFVVSARKYRPTVFSHVLGQSHITTTLKNAIKDNHVAQAFLFCGPRGVGKTTCARILAKTINCQQVTADTEPCNACESCRSFSQNSSFNIYELDAASNNSVEDIRSLVEQVRYPPQAGQYKVYIIDEVHMLSHAAFNAFLKTLEEPPSYAIFILATTEKHKIIPTILSRCQIFDFQRIQPQAIVQQLKQIADQERIAYEEAALHLISQKADGALRDALSIFDLIATFGAGKEVTYQATLENLHVLDDAYYFKLTDTLLQGDIPAALLLYDEILRSGFDGQYFIGGLSEHFRNLLVCQDRTTLQLLEVAESIQGQYQAQAALASPSFLFSSLHLINQCDIHYKSSQNKRLHVELTLIELAQILHPASVSPSATTAQTQPAPQQATPVTSQPTSPAPKPIEEPQKDAHVGRETPLKPLNPKPAPVSAQQSSLQATIKLPQLDELKATIGQEASNNSQVAAPATVQQPFTKETLMKHWHAYAAQLKASGKLPAYRLLHQDIELEGTTILVKVTNAVQEDILADIKEGLLADLRASLQHTSLDIRGVLVKQAKQKKPYTAQEKFNYLAKKYPNLLLLQKRLNLEVVD